MTELKPYSEYKDSGVGWIGVIPAEWKKIKLSYLFDDIGSGGTPNTANQAYYVDGEINWINTGDLNDSYLINTKKKITQKALDDLSTLKVHPRNSLIVAMYGATIGKLAITTIEAASNQACCVLSNPLKTRVKFMFYWFLSNREDIINSASGGGQPNISQSLIRSLNVYLPQTLKEQDYIINFLDKKTSEIDTLISDKERLIELLEEKRQAVITETVTKGLDPNVKMKDSGIEWIGEIPEHWAFAPIRRVVKEIKDGTHGSYNRVIVGEPLLSAKNVNDNQVIIEDTESLISEEDYKEITKNGFPKKNDLLITIVGTIGRVSLYEYDYPLAFQRSVAFLRFNSNVNPRYYFYYTQSIYYTENLLSFAKTSAQSGVYMGDVLKTMVLIPGKKEQNDITNYLDRVLVHYHELIDLLNIQISKLKEYRESLIYEAVTGKIDVRDYASDKEEVY